MSSTILLSFGSAGGGGADDDDDAAASVASHLDGPARERGLSWHGASQHTHFGGKGVRQYD